MANGMWVAKGTAVFCGCESRSTIERSVNRSDVDLAVEKAKLEGYYDIDVYFHEDEDCEYEQDFMSFSECLEYDFSQN
jgi:hypothetical protein